MARSKDGAINFAAIEKEMAEHPEDWFSAEEADRRLKETFRRWRGGRTMNMTTGQNLEAPFLSDDDLKVRGYPCNCGFE